MLASISKNTATQYNVTYKLWWDFCKLKKFQPYQANLTAVLSFLTEQFNKGASYGTLNSHRSALSLLLGNEIGSQDQVKRLLKGAYKLRPTAPKYTSTWDPQVVLDYISNWFPNTDLSLQQITKKLTILLAICTRHRVQTLSLIKLRNIKIDHNGVKILISDIIKTSAPGRNQPLLILPYFDQNKNICLLATPTLRFKNLIMYFLFFLLSLFCHIVQTIRVCVKLINSANNIKYVFSN
ncbi:unnamed protein product [Plutella xylostella]|uniref:(diamondback moth) hypothetical protein n=1 Tax=Plutella xylostella TaxID=51655 RepID=A0A8S4D5T5_PLUXY|nr:unnamed protein product [Plutella xylostella]